MTTKDAARHKASARMRNFRKIHRKVAIVLFVFFAIVSITGVLLAWKKHSFGLIQPPTSKGISSNLTTWLPLDSLLHIATTALHDSVSPTLSAELEKIDVRPQKGIAKFVFEDDYWEVQVDGTNGEVLLIDQRRSDFIENIHDGTLLDVLFNTKGDPFKISFSTIMGVALLLLTISGFWLWYGPKKLRKQRKQ